MVALAVTFTACKKEQAANPRCRIFEQDPEQAQGDGALDDLRAAYQDLQLIAECARAARQTVSEWMEQHQVQQRLQALEDRIEGVGRTVLEGARDTINSAKTGAEGALQEGAERAQEAAKALQDLSNQ